MSLATRPLKSATHPHLQAEIHYDNSPWEPDDCTITYNTRARYILGNTLADSERDRAIESGIRSGELIGLPVWAYVHSGVAIKAANTNPFHCQWDSGRSGWAYLTKEEAKSFMGVKRMTKAVREEVLGHIRIIVDAFSSYLNGEVYGFVIRDTNTDEVLDSCWGYYGIEHVQSEAASALKQMESLTPLQMELFV